MPPALTMQITNTLTSEAHLKPGWPTGEPQPTQTAKENRHTLFSMWRLHFGGGADTRAKPSELSALQPAQTRAERCGTPLYLQ